ncbi:HIT family protein [Candidatus Pelagibacter sp.]|uniref:HIT family protein n=1 Tax=Candidatus Pelagibacter sp. TaxID=2024849 RepID=UPI003F85DD5E
MKDPNYPCIFFKIRKEELQFENQLAYSSIDTYPVSEFHSLIFPKRHVETYFELTKEEIQACNDLILKTKEKILKQNPSVKGFNIGANAGKSAGQSIMHCHIHLIPRREGDIENPQGGVRSVIPKKQYYKKK